MTDNNIYYSKYLKYKNKYIALKNSIKNSQQGGGKDKREVYLFKAEWCPHCKGFEPTWDKLKENHKNKYKFITYDSDKNSDKISEWKIEGFPTIIVKRGGEALEYLGPNEYNSVLEFIEHI
tara:strand:- start:654 stop:1016 length:363 start_codon:yes stop_codon:yes gene_type:complete